MSKKTGLIILLGIVTCLFFFGTQAKASSTVYVCSEADCPFTFTLGDCIPPPVQPNDSSLGYCGGSKIVSCSSMIEFSGVPAGTHPYSYSGCGIFREGSVTVDGQSPLYAVICPQGQLPCCPSPCYGMTFTCTECLGSPTPTVITGSATCVTSTSATLNGTVNPNGSSTTYYFQYGKSTGYGSTTATFSAGAGTSNVAAGVSIIGISPDTTYHYRVVAANSAGASYGNDMTFRSACSGGFIGGTVKKSFTDAPIEGALITTDGGGQTTSRADGIYLMADHPAGTFTISAQASGYSPVSCSIEIPECGNQIKEFVLTPLTSVFPDIKINGQDGSIAASSTTPILITVSLDPIGHAGQDADWWVIETTLDGTIRCFDITTGSMLEGLFPTYQGGLFGFSPVQLLNLPGLEEGFHTFYFGVDLNMNGAIDTHSLYLDRVSVSVTAQ